MKCVVNLNRQRLKQKAVEVVFGQLVQNHPHSFLSFRGFVDRRSRNLRHADMHRARK
jgi:hypothetical protein